MIDENMKLLYKVIPFGKYESCGYATADQLRKV